MVIVGLNFIHDFVKPFERIIRQGINLIHSSFFQL